MEVVIAPFMGVSVLACGSWTRIMSRIRLSADAYVLTDLVWAGCTNLTR